ncbi:unnamed protein product [Durusdinium trenchii]|uniref:Uncharacterized protein n=1 Tax=Durusdinium trenchii TaxID=1381693 RepID=A0ABP0JWS5_9DINO
MEVNDRFQFCHDGYRDITLLFDMSGVICEVQMQIKGIQEVKKSGGHKAYRVQREVNELIFEAAVQNSEEDLASLVKAYNVTGQGTKDKNGRSALHYTCQHGALKATRVLLAAGSSIWLEDDNGVLPFELALKQKRFETLFLCLTVMMRKTLTSYDGGKQDGDGQVQRQALPFLEPFLTKVAQQSTATAAAAVRALLTAGADQVLSAGSESLLDSALQKGHSEMVNMPGVLVGRMQPSWLVCMQRGDGTPYCAHCFKETLPGHLKAAAKLADSGYARAALLANADPRAQQAFAVGKRTALMAFAAAGDLELCRQLVAARSEVQWIDGSCCSAVHYALALKRHEVADFLRQQRAITEARATRGTGQDEGDRPVRWVSGTKTVTVYVVPGPSCRGALSGSQKR